MYYYIGFIVFSMNNAIPIFIFSPQVFNTYQQHCEQNVLPLWYKVG